MTALVSDWTSTGTPSNATARANLEQLRDFISESIGSAAQESLTIAAGAVTPTVALVKVDTEGSAATDDLDTIATTNHPDGRIIVLRSADPSRVVTVKNGSGNISLRDSKDLVLRTPTHFVVLARMSSTWVEVLRSVANELRTVRALTSDTTLVASDSGTIITNTGAAADRNHTLPAATVGMWLRVCVTAAFKIKLTANGTDTIRDDDGTTVSAAGGNTEIAATVGNYFEIQCHEAAKWVVIAARGTLTTT
jgi:hypothetical protein